MQPVHPDKQAFLGVSRPLKTVVRMIAVVIAIIGAILGPLFLALSPSTIERLPGWSLIGLLISVMIYAAFEVYWMSRSKKEPIQPTETTRRK